MTSYLTNSVSVYTSQRRVEIQTSKRNKLFITYLTRSTECLPTLPSSISTISMPVETTLFNTCAQCSVNYKVRNMG